METSMIFFTKNFLVLLITFTTVESTIAHGAPEDEHYYSQQQFSEPSTPAYNPYANASAPPVDESVPLYTQPASVPNVTVQQTVVQKNKTIIVQNKDEKKKEEYAGPTAEHFVTIFKFLWDIDRSGRTIFGGFLGLLVGTGLSLTLGNKFASTLTGCSAVGGTIIGGGCGFGRTLYCNANKPDPTVTITVKATYQQQS